MKALVFERNLPRYAASRVASMLGSGRGAGVGPLQLLDAVAPALPGADWFHLRPLAVRHLRLRPGHPGRAQLALLRGPGQLPVRPRPRGGGRPRRPAASTTPDARCPPGPGRSSSRCSAVPPVTSTPRARTAPRGTPACAATWPSGTWLPASRPGSAPTPAAGGPRADLAVHTSQLHAVPESFSDEDAVIVEPTACAVHAVLSAGVEPGEVVAVIGAGTLGLATVAALRHVADPGHACRVLVGAKHGHQRQLAESPGRRHHRGPGPAGPGRAPPGRLAGGGRATDRRRRRGLRLRRAARLPSPRRCPWSARAAGWCWSGCRARCPSIWLRSGTAN